MYKLKDNSKDISLAKIVSILDNHLKKIFNKNGIGNNMLKSVGLSDMANKYYDELNPKSRNGEHLNDNRHYNPSHALQCIIDTVKSNDEALYRLLKAIINNLDDLNEADFELLNNNLNIIGFELKENYNEISESYEYDIAYKAEGSFERRNQISFLSQELKNIDEEFVHYYEEAIKEYGNSHFTGTVHNCRTLIEKYFSSLDDDNNDYSKGILTATDETTPNGTANTPRYSIKGIFEFWLENRKGFNRYRLFTTFYSLLSGLGTHGEEQPTKDDALLSLRITEEILLWSINKL